MRRLYPLLAAGLFSSLAVIGVSSPVRAECPWFPIPPATLAAPSAREVIVGTVIENVDDQLYHFRLRVDQVLRGRATVGEIREVEFLYPGWPFIENGGVLVLNDQGEPVPPCEPIPGSKGNVIAFSLGALATDGETRYNAASWISGNLPISRDLPRTTLAEMRRLAALPATDAAADPARTTGPDAGIASVLGIGAATLLAVLAVDRRRRRFPG